jgi:tetratricopeptide (TPR) repeat protein
MEKPKNLLNLFVIVLILILTSTNHCKSESIYKKMIYKAFVNGEMYKWEEIIHTMEENNYNKTMEQKLELINYYYGFTAHLIHKKHYDKAMLFCTKGESLISQVIAQAPQNASSYAYKGAFLGFRIGMSKFKAVVLGPESEGNINKAYELDPQNAQVLIDKGNLFYYKPSFFGGDKIQALKFYIKAISILEKNKDYYHNWIYLNTLTNIALAYEKTNQDILSKTMFERILRLEPNFKWVKNELYPELLHKIQN